MADEEVLFEGKGVRITSTRAEIHGTTYAMNGVTSVARRKRAPQNGVALVLVVVGLVGLLSCGGLGGLSFLARQRILAERTSSMGSVQLREVEARAAEQAPLMTLGALGAVFGAGGLLVGSLSWSRRTTHVVLLGTAGGERAALRTPHQDLADSVATAIESAIVRRG